ncbi:MAG: GNAT family N-acetyltransferase [Sphingomonadales bacterium]|nr:MAG: GNAT family N-acetyltransferase [Sphingomonadales bacterium]
MVRLSLAPWAGEAELGDPAFTGEWADFLAETAEETVVPPWCNYIARRDGVAVGSGGFKEAPDETGAVEIGYITFIPARGTGVAKAIAAGLVEIARAEGAGRVIAHTLPEQNPSTRALAANGFVKIAEVDDPDDGPVWRWELPLSGAPQTG